MRLVLISDTHNKHHRLVVPNGDVLIHCGDTTNTGSTDAHSSFLEWFQDQPHFYKLYINGNHDFNSPTIPMWYRNNSFLLFNSGLEIEKIKFWGSPFTPKFGMWAFMKPDEELEPLWAEIPNDTDVLITHGPPHGILDRPYSQYENVGSKTLLDRVLKIKPKIHAFGHIHGDRGEKMFNGTHFINCSSVGEDYKLRGEPIVVDL